MSFIPTPSQTSDIQTVVDGTTAGVAFDHQYLPKIVSVHTLALPLDVDPLLASYRHRQPNANNLNSYDNPYKASFPIRNSSCRFNYHGFVFSKNIQISESYCGTDQIPHWKLTNVEGLDATLPTPGGTWSVYNETMAFYGPSDVLGVDHGFAEKDNLSITQDEVSSETSKDFYTKPAETPEARAEDLAIKIKQEPLDDYCLASCGNCKETEIHDDDGSSTDPSGRKHRALYVKENSKDVYNALVTDISKEPKDDNSIDGDIKKGITITSDTINHEKITRYEAVGPSMWDSCNIKRPWSWSSQFNMRHCRIAQPDFDNPQSTECSFPLASAECDTGTLGLPGGESITQGSSKGTNCHWCEESRGIHTLDEPGARDTSQDCMSTARDVLLDGARDLSQDCMSAARDVLMDGARDPSQDCMSTARDVLLDGDPMMPVVSIQDRCQVKRQDSKMTGYVDDKNLSGLMEKEVKTERTSPFGSQEFPSSLCNQQAGQGSEELSLSEGEGSDCIKENKMDAFDNWTLYEMVEEGGWNISAEGNTCTLNRKEDDGSTAPKERTKKSFTASTSLGNLVVKVKKEIVSPRMLKRELCLMTGKETKLASETEKEKRETIAGIQIKGFHQNSTETEDTCSVEKKTTMHERNLNVEHRPKKEGKFRPLLVKIEGKCKKSHPGGNRVALDKKTEAQEGFQGKGLLQGKSHANKKKGEDKKSKRKLHKQLHKGTEDRSKHGHPKDYPKNLENTSRISVEGMKDKARSKVVKVDANRANSRSKELYKKHVYKDFRQCRDNKGKSLDRDNCLDGINKNCRNIDNRNCRNNSNKRANDNSDLFDVLGVKFAKRLKSCKIPKLHKSSQGTKGELTTFSQKDTTTSQTYITAVPEKVSEKSCTATVVSKVALKGEKHLNRKRRHQDVKQQQSHVEPREAKQARQDAPKDFRTILAQVNKTLKRIMEIRKNREQNENGQKEGKEPAGINT